MFDRIINVLRAHLRRFFSGLQDNEPERLMEKQEEQIRKQMTLLHQALVARAGASEKFLGLIKRLQADEDEMKSKAASLLRAGQDRSAAEFALQLQHVRRDLEHARSQWQQSEALYKELVVVRDSALKDASERMNELRKDLDELRLKKTLADVCARAGNVATDIGGCNVSLENIHNQIKEEIAIAEGRAWAAHEILLPSDHEAQLALRQSQEDMALAELASELGVPIKQSSKEKNTTSYPSSL